MNRKKFWIILMSLLAVLLVGCEGTDVVQQTQPPEVTAAPTQTPPKDTGSPTEEPTQTVSPTEEPPEVTGSPTEEPTQTVFPTEEPAQTVSPTEEPTQTVPPTLAPTQTPTAAPTATPKPTATPAPTPKPTATPTPKPTATPAPTQAPSQSAGPSPAVPYPTASGTAVEKNDSAVIDYSNAKDGYVMLKWTGGSAKVAVQVKGPNNSEKYTYYLRTDGNYDVLPLSDGNGTYQFVVCKNVSGTKYSAVLSLSVNVQLTDSLAPFLRPNQYVNYTASSQAVKKGQELVKGTTDNLSKVKAVYTWVVTNLTYDYDKAKTVQSGYLPDVDKVMAEKKGICFDYASLMSSMLRSQGVPVKLVVGYTSTGEYHAWINVWSEESGWMDSVIYFDGSTWKLMDPTFASSGHQSQTIMDYIGNTANYKERFAY